jgi:hypothetical protein
LCSRSILVYHSFGQNNPGSEQELRTKNRTNNRAFYRGRDFKLYGRTGVGPQTEIPSPSSSIVIPELSSDYMRAIAGNDTGPRSGGQFNKVLNVIIQILAVLI